MRIWLASACLSTFVAILWLNFGISQSVAQTANPSPAAAPAGQAESVAAGSLYLTPPPATRPDWLVEHDPVTPNASPEAKALLHYLYQISLKHTMTGQHNFPNDQEYTTDLKAGQWGKTPAIYGTDFGFSQYGDKDSAYVREDNIQEVIKQYKAGHIIALCWHEMRPIDFEPVAFMSSVQGKLTQQQWEDVITPGTELYGRWTAQVDVVAEYLKQLQDAHVPVLFRPYHEMNGNWFWWGNKVGEKGTKVIYQNIWNRFINVHHLTNLIWVWNCDQPSDPSRQFVDYFPGQQYVDVLALDDYAAFQQRFYDEMNALSDGKVLAISECGTPPTLDIYNTQPKWTYWMEWATDSPKDQAFVAASGGGRRGGAGAGGRGGGRGARAASGPSTRGGGFAGGGPTTRRGAGGFAGGGGGRRGGAGPNMTQMVDDPRMFSMQDPEYISMTNEVRAASGLPPISPPPFPVPATQPAGRGN